MCKLFNLFYYTHKMSRSVLIPSTQKDCKGHGVGHSNISTYIHKNTRFPHSTAK